MNVRQTSCVARSGTDTICPTPCKWGLEHPRTAFSWRSPRMSVMRVIVLYMYTKSEIRRPSRLKDMADFRSRR